MSCDEKIDEEEIIFIFIDIKKKVEVSLVFVTKTIKTLSVHQKKFFKKTTRISQMHEKMILSVKSQIGLKDLANSYSKTDTCI